MDMQPGLDRRDFHKWTLAALGGMTAGLAAGCGQQNAAPEKPITSMSGPATGTPETATPVAATPEELIASEPHVCRGLNTCKGLGRSKDNDCAGLGTCASVAEHECAGHNECKGQGGCGSDPGMNACKGKGGCHVPLMDEAWTVAREAFEAAMKKQGKEVGAAPAKS